MGPARGAPVEFRSQFERRLRERLDREGILYAYEKHTYRITVDIPGGRCGVCGSGRVVRGSRYTPDFFFQRWVVEAKGKFTARDRKRILALRAQHPGSNFALLFQRDNWLTSRKAQRYSEWAEAKGIPWSVGWFKPEWLR